MAIGAFAAASRVLAAEDPPLGRAFPIEGTPARAYLQAAIDAASAVRERLWDPESRRLKRSFCRNTSAVDAFADDCAPASPVRQGRRLLRTGRVFCSAPSPEAQPVHLGALHCICTPRPERILLQITLYCGRVSQVATN